MFGSIPFYRHGFKWRQRRLHVWRGNEDGRVDFHIPARAKKSTNGIVYGLSLNGNLVQVTHKRKRRGDVQSRTSFALLLDEWNEGHHTSALDRGCEFALVGHANAAALARHDFREGRQVTAQSL